MKLSVVIPCYNEKETIREVVEAVRNAPYDVKEIIIVDDYSTDGTRELLKAEIVQVLASGKRLEFCVARSPVT